MEPPEAEVTVARVISFVGLAGRASTTLDLVVRRVVAYEMWGCCNFPLTAKGRVASRRVCSAGAVAV